MKRQLIRVAIAFFILTALNVIFSGMTCSLIHLYARESASEKYFLALACASVPIFLVTLISGIVACIINSEL